VNWLVAAQIRVAAITPPPGDPMTTHFRTALLGTLLLCGAAVQVDAATAASQYGITWTFDHDYQTGQFANGDWWVVGPVTITRITPEDTNLADDVDTNGTVINPMPDIASPYLQSWDSRIAGGTTYHRALNVARHLPVSVNAGNSLVSIASDPAGAGTDKLCINDVAILTVLASAPPAGSFRPPYAGTDKSIPGKVADLDLSIFRSLAPLASAPTYASFEPKFTQALIDIIGQWPNSSVKAAHAGPNYGRDIGYQVGDAVLWLNLNQPTEQKRALLAKLVQRGIDTYGLAKAGMVWLPNGGHNVGRKMPLVIAAKALGRNDMLSWCDAGAHLIFQEDMQHFVIAQVDVDTPRANAGDSPYTTAMIGIPEWASNPINERHKTGSQWDKPYRSVNGSANTGIVLAAELMGLRQAWNWEPLFDYTNERYWPIEGITPISPVKIPLFHRDMWKAYRNRPMGPQAPTLAPSADQSTTLGTSKAITLTIGDADTPVASLVVTASTSNTTLVPSAGLVLTGNTASRTLTITPAAGQSGSATITVTVADGGGLTAQDTFVLTVSNDQTAPATPAAPTVSNDGSSAPVLSGTTEALATITIRADGVVVATVTADATGAWTWTASGLTAGNHAISVSATDAAGNTSAASPATAIVVTANASGGGSGSGGDAGESGGGCGLGSGVAALLTLTFMVFTALHLRPAAMPDTTVEMVGPR